MLRTFAKKKIKELVFGLWEISSFCGSTVWFWQSRNISLNWRLIMLFYIIFPNRVIEVECGPNQEQKWTHPQEVFSLLKRNRTGAFLKMNLLISSSHRFKSAWQSQISSLLNLALKQTWQLSWIGFPGIAKSRVQPKEACEVLLEELLDRRLFSRKRGGNLFISLTDIEYESHCFARFLFWLRLGEKKQKKPHQEPRKLHEQLANSWTHDSTSNTL